MTSNDINAFRQHLWSLFQSYSYIPSGGGNGGPLARRLSESGYRAVISLVATTDVMSRFFLAEDEITQRECLKRLDSERFREEVWEEMISAEERLRDCAGGVNEDAGKEEAELGELDVAISTDYDYHIIRPSLGHKTISWNIFIAVLLLRLSNSLHLRIEDHMLRGCREALHPSAQLLPAQGSRVASKVDDFASFLSQVKRRSCIDAEQPATTVTRSALEDHARDPAPRRSSASGNFFTSVRIKTSLHDKAPGSGVEVAAEVMQPTFLSPSESRGMRTDDARGRLEQVAGSVGGPSSATVGVGTAAHRMKQRGACMEVKSGIPNDEHPHQSSPPPRPKHSSMMVPTISRPGCIGSARGRNVPIDVMKLHQRLTRGKENRLEETGGDALFRGSREGMTRSSLETTLEVWNTAQMKGNIRSANTGSEVCHTRHDEEIIQSDDERCRPASRCSFVASSCSPSPNREQVRGAKKILVPLPTNLKDVPLCSLGKEPSFCKENTPALVNALDGTLRQRKQIAAAKGPIACGGTTGSKEAPQQKPLELLSPQRGARRKPGPPLSPSNRALSRTARGQRTVQPIVPRTRALPVDGGIFKLETANK
ncbi:hypothetical protein MOQ_008604 [Trypanosoma cruzi marinkellei]|uniref:Uncharacterized protein n=1 Tax=Trypanosoma cruzi marinkellei TaxID=85056 RepID=K2MPV7_TRYCR|nr:hypothetical protein MOQ_008604 [Trypanosoma cruzi marinkellei]